MFSTLVTVKLGAVALSNKIFSRKILFLDICGTITRENTTLGFLKFIGITPSFIDLVIGRILWRMFSYDYLRPRLLKKLKNISQVDIYRLSEKYVSSLKFQKDVLHYVRKYQSEGYEVVIVSATLHPIAKYIAQRLGASDCFSSKLAFKKGQCKGMLSEDLLANKLASVSHLFGFHTAIISDNYGDYELMLYCDERIAIAHSDKDTRYWDNKKIKYIRVHNDE